MHFQKGKITWHHSFHDYPLFSVFTYGLAVSAGVEMSQSWMGQIG